jgi:signal transduction histidine kinase
LKNDLVANVSHELKTPLASIRLLVDTLLDQSEWDRRQVHEYLQLMAKENDRLTRLIDNFLAFSRMERNKHAFEFAEVDVAEVIRQSVELAQERLHAANGDVAVDIETDLPPVRADADALVTVLLNLLDNACKYSPGKARIAVRAFADNGSVGIDIRDQGVGLSRAASRKVFKRFYQVDRRVSRETGGVGLGLSIVQFIVAAHGGSIRVRSQPGHGSTFTVMLPAWQPLPATA